MDFKSYDKSLFCYPFLISHEIFKSNCYVKKDTGEKVWIREIDDYPCPVTMEIYHLSLLYEWKNEKWNITTLIGNPSQTEINDLEKIVGENKDFPNMWFEPPDVFKNQGELIKKKLEMIKIQSELDTKIKECSGNHKYISDGHHTFDELYQYRMAYHALAVNCLPAICEAHKSKKHYDGKDCFGGGWFVVSCKLDGKLVSNHYKIEEGWELFKVPEEEREKWQFNLFETPQKQLKNLMDYLKKH